MTIEADSTIANIRTKRPHPLLEAKAVRIMEPLPRLQPAILEEKTIAVPYSIPITCKLWPLKIHAVADIGLRKGRKQPRPQLVVFNYL